MSKERKTILTAYGLFATLMAVSFIPAMWAIVAASVLYLAALITPYIIRRRAAPRSLTENHMTYIIRSIWIASLMASITVAAGACYVLALYDPSSINDCMQGLMSGDIDIESCASDFLDANKSLLYVGGFIAAAPVTLYCLWRLFRGGRAAMHSLPMKNVKAWL